MQTQKKLDARRRRSELVKVAKLVRAESIKKAAAAAKPKKKRRCGCRGRK